MKKVTSQRQRIEIKKAQEKPLNRKKQGWIKFVRFLIYVISIIGVTVGASLIKTGGLSAAYADGTYAAKTKNGEIFFFIFLMILCGNIMWGILRWFLRGYHEKWKPGRVIGKLVGGGIWRALLIMPLIILSLLMIAPKISDVISARIMEKQSVWEKISFSEPLDHLEYISEHLEDYTVEELEKELAPYLFNNIDFDVDASQNISKKQSPGFLAQNVSAYSSDVKILNKAKLSSKGRFVVFYTDTGDDKISDSQAEELAGMLENVVDNYNSNLGFEYKYEKTPCDLSKLFKMNAVLEDSGINANILNTAMPVYVVNPYKDGSNILASYAGRRFADFDKDLLIKLGDLFGEEAAKLYNSTPSYPFVNILPSNVGSESLAIVTAHELGHHYIANYSYDNHGGIGSDDDFIDETAPNWMAINVLPNETKENLINKGHYNRDYLAGTTGTSINNLDYNAVAFLENYYEIVPNAKKIIMEAVYRGDALDYLYEQAGEENFQKVMVALAEKNLTGNYNGKLTNTTLPEGEELECTDLCEKDYWIDPVATQYLYFATSEYHDVKIRFEGDKDIKVSVLGKNVVGGWEVIESGEEEHGYSIDDAARKKYETIAFAVANAATGEMDSYKVEITMLKLENLIAVAGEFDFDGIYKDLGQGCFELNLDSLFDIYGQFMDLGGAVIDLLARVDGEPEWAEVKNEWETETSNVKNGVEKAKRNLARYRVTVCANYVEKGRDFDDVKSTLQKAMGWNMNFYDERDGADRMSVFAGLDLLKRQGRIYVLAESDGEMGLVTINVAER